MEQKIKIFHVLTDKNIGGAGGFNIGMKKAVESGYKYVWVMDDDTLCNPDALEQFFIADKKTLSPSSLSRSINVSSFPSLSVPTLSERETVV